MIRLRRVLVAFLASVLLAARAPASAPDLPEISAKLQRFPSARGSASESVRLKELFDLFWSARMREFPEVAVAIGYSGVDELPDFSPEALALGHRLSHLELSALESVDRSRLSPSEQLSDDLARRHLQLEIGGERFGSFDPWHNDYMLVDGMTDRILGGLDLLVAAPPHTVADYDRIVARMREFPRMVDQGIVRLATGLKLGITPPRVTLGRVPERVLGAIPADSAKSPILEPFRRMPEPIPPGERERLGKEAREILAGEIVPALRRYHDYLARTYVPGARETIPMSAMPDGEAWYEWLLRYYTTTDLAPAEIHRLGLSEVARIRKEMDAVIVQTGFRGGFREFSAFLRTDPRFFFDKPEDLVSAYRDIAKRVDPELIRLFRRLPRLPYGVRPMDEAEGKTAPSAYYESGSLAAGKSGWLLVNTTSLSSRPKWEMEALTLHEAVPGHHLAYALAEEVGDLPEWRKWEVYPAFSEGWALYAEGLGEEIGVYRDPYSRFGRLNLEIWRAIRLVVDTGLQTMGWTRQQAIDYCRENSARSEHDIEQEVDRYISQPGSAPAYKIGERKIRELRRFAERELGPAFDVRDFHDEILGTGQLPMDLLQKRIQAWVATAKGSAASR